LKLKDLRERGIDKEKIVSPTLSKASGSMCYAFPTPETDDDWDN
jgi:hypothetical protein